MEPFWTIPWLDDVVLIGEDIGDRLQKAEKHLRDGITLVIGSGGCHEGKFTTWSHSFHAVRINPIWEHQHTQPKIGNVHSVLAKVLEKSFVSRRRLDSVIGVLPRVISFISITNPFIQRSTRTQNHCRKNNKRGVWMSQFLRKDLKWWNDLVFQSEFAGCQWSYSKRTLDSKRYGSSLQTRNRLLSRLCGQHSTFYALSKGPFRTVKLLRGSYHAQ